MISKRQPNNARLARSLMHYVDVHKMPASKVSLICAHRSTTGSSILDAKEWIESNIKRFTDFLVD